VTRFHKTRGTTGVMLAVLRRGFFDKLAGARLEILDRAGYVPNTERANAFNRLALDFLRE
jgi:hypothetical protein